MAALLAWLLVAPTGVLLAQEEGDAPASRTGVTLPGSGYDAGWLHQQIFGHSYRELWTTPIDAPVLDLATFAGGLTPLTGGGGSQTRSLRFQGRDGRQYLFRLIDKDPSMALPAEYRGTIVSQVVRDQTSALHPDAALIAAPLAEAVGVLHLEPQLFVMPGDPVLGEYLEEFAGRLGTLELRLGGSGERQPEFEGSLGIIDTEEFFDLLEDDPSHSVDAPAFLTARLLDLFLGDRDRHPDQWRWARFAKNGGYVWRPIPLDRDQAFVKYGGLVSWGLHLWVPQFVSFGGGYPNLVFATWNGRHMDRRLLVGLERPAWDSVGLAFHERMTDSVIEAAVRRMPLEHYEKNGAKLTRLLKQRRDKIPELVDEFYRLLVSYVDIHASDEPEVANVDRLPDGQVELQIFARGANGEGAEGDRHFRRRFSPTETREIRLFMHGADDLVRVRGEAEQSIRIHVIGGGGNDRLVDSSTVRSSGGKTLLHDSRGENEFVGGPRTVIDRRELLRDPETERFSAPERPNPLEVHHRNWGSWWRPVVWAGLESDLGLFFGGGASLYKYSFRQAPYKYRMRWRAGYTTTPQRFRADFFAEFPAVSHNLRAEIEVMVSGVEILNFYGFGNETAEAALPSSVKVLVREYTVAPSMTLAAGSNLDLSFGAVAKFSKTFIDSGTVIADIRPRGSDSFSQIGVGIGAEYDTRNRSVGATRGVLLRADGKLYPPVIDVEETIHEVSGEARAFLSPGGETWPTLALRVAGKRIWGDFPFHGAAFIGGHRTLRGFRRERFTGDASVYGSAEVRVPLFRYRFLLPGEFGILGFTDVGRVFFSEEDSNQWHVGAGGGIWIAPTSRSNTVALTLANSAEGLRVYARAGFAF